MRRTTVLALALTAAAVSLPAPASAVDVRYGLSGGIKVSPDFMACAQVSAAFGQPFVGTFSSVAVMQGPGTKVATVRSVVPVSGTGSWQHCIPGGYLGAVAGDGKFVLEATSTSGELLIAQQCVIERGSLTCV